MFFDLRPALHFVFPNKKTATKNCEHFLTPLLTFPALTVKMPYIFKNRKHCSLYYSSCALALLLSNTRENSLHSKFVRQIIFMFCHEPFSEIFFHQRSVLVICYTCYTQTHYAFVMVAVTYFQEVLVSSLYAIFFISKRLIGRVSLIYY